MSYRTKCLWICVSAMFALTTITQADTSFIEVGQANSGHVIYFGRDLNTQAMAVDLGRSVVNADTSWSLWLRPIGDPTIKQLGITRLPFNPPRPALPAAAHQHDRRQALIESMGASLRPRRAQLERLGVSAFTTQDLRGLAPSDLVDSVRAESDWAWSIKWAGEPNWFKVTYAAPSLKVSQELPFREKANRILNGLRANQLVIIDRGFTSCTQTDSQRKLLENDLAAVRDGGALEAHGFIPSRVLKNIQEPTDLRTIVQGGGQR